MLKTIITAVACAWIGMTYAHEKDSLTNLKSSTTPKVTYVETRFLNDSVNLHYVNNIQLFEQEWNKLAHPKFWKTIMTLSPDSCVINIGATRQIVEIMSVSDWDLKSDKEKDAYRDSVRVSVGIDSLAKVYMTTGKKDFYSFDNVLPTISRGVEVFREQDVDPWYAQAILMIESPGRLAKSNVGAYGSFQLMPAVARAQGLTVNRYVDERKDFEKSAIGASSLIEKVCIPEAKVILNKYGIPFQENELWFRLFVMHIYHAGAGNVAGVINKINPTKGGMELIQSMWVTENGSFRNASQNYSQIALAAMIVLEEMLWDC